MHMKPCPRCGQMIPYGPTYCDTCRPIAEAEMQEARDRRAAQRAKKYNREYNKRRDPKYTVFYRSKAWKMTSKSKLQQCGYQCEAKLPVLLCGTTVGMPMASGSSTQDSLKDLPIWTTSVVRWVPARVHG